MSIKGKQGLNSFNEVTSGQSPITPLATLWLLLLVVLWATNAVIVKITIRDIPPLWAAFLRFAPALPLVMLFIRFNGSGFSLTKKEAVPVFLAGFIDTLQIYTFNFGSQFTSGGRVTLFIFSYPLLVPILAPFFVKEEHFEKKNIAACLIAFIGLFIVLRESLFSPSGSTIKGDVIELISALLISIKIVYVKRLSVTINKWKILFWSFAVMIFFFMSGAVFFENFNIHEVRPDAWLALTFQCIAISVICFMSWQYLITRHNSSGVSVFFFATPLFGMIIGVLLLSEPFDMSLLVSCLLVGAGIYIVNRK